MRVLLVAPSHDILGGQSVQAAGLARELAGEPSVEVTFVPINPRLPGPLRYLQRIKYVRTIVTSAAYVGRLLALVPRHDLVHVSSHAALSFLIAPTPAILIARCWRKPVILNYHSSEADDHLRRWRRSAPWTMRQTVLVVPSEFLVRAFAGHGLRARVIVNGIDTERFRFRERRPLRPVFLTNRQLKAHYNVGAVLRAFGLVQERFGEARLVVAGDGTERSRLERLARELGLRGVEFVGEVAPQHMPNLYAAADVFLNGSDRDNLPVSILEAFSAGLPVVTTNPGGIPEMVRADETGLLVAPGDHVAMAMAAIRLLEEPGLAAAVARNAREASRRYEWAVVRGDWLALFAELSRPASGDPVPVQ